VGIFRTCFSSLRQGRNLLPDKALQLTGLRPGHPTRGRVAINQAASVPPRRQAQQLSVQSVGRRERERQTYIRPTSGYSCPRSVSSRAF